MFEMFFLAGNRDRPLDSTVGAIFSPKIMGGGCLLRYFESLYLKRTVRDTINNMEVTDRLWLHSKKKKIRTSNFTE